MDLPFLVDSIDSSAVRGQLQFFTEVDASQLTLLAVCIWWVQTEKFVHTNSGRNSAEVSTISELICLRLQASLFFVVFPRSATVGAC